MADEIPEGWKECRVSDVAEVVGGGTPRTDVAEYWNGEIPWITPRDLSNFKGRYISRGERNISKEGLRDSSAIILPKGAILLSTRAPVGYLAIAKNEVTTNQGFRSLVPFNSTDTVFLFYLLKNNVEYLKSQATGTTFGELAGSVLKSLTFLFPPLAEQRAIASVLSSLDDKIDLLHRENQTLEQIAETLFRQWFVDCDYSCTISDLIEIQNGYAFKSKDFKDVGVNGVIKIKNISENIVDIYNCDFIEELVANQTDSRFVIKTGDILIAMTGAPGKMGIVPQTERKLWLNQRVGLLKEKYNGSRFLAYLQLKSDYGQDYIDNTATGSVQPNISGIGIENCKFPKITEKQIKEYSEKLLCLYEKVIFNLGQINTLEKLRDTLLPKLMSGEVRVMV